MSLFRKLVDAKLLAILTTLLDNPDEHFHLQELSRRSSVSLSTTFRLVQDLAHARVMTITTIGKLKVYRLDPEKKDELERLLSDTR
jgi:DNA-binding IclR family transcriptional regulator